MSTIGLRRLICVIISTCNYAVWSLVPFGCFDAFRKGSVSGDKGKRIISHSIWIVAFLTNKCCFVKDSGEFHHPDSQTHSEEVTKMILTYLYAHINLIFCWTEAARLKKTNFQKSSALRASKLLVKSKREIQNTGFVFHTSNWWYFAWIFSLRLILISLLKSWSNSFQNRRVIGLSHANTVFTTLLFYRMSHTRRLCYIFFLIPKRLLQTPSLSSFLTSSQILLSPLEDFIKDMSLVAKGNALQGTSPSYNCLPSWFHRTYRTGYQG